MALVQAAPRRGTFLSGGPISDIFDLLQVFNYAVAGVATGKGIVKGVKERTTFEDYLAQQGMRPGIARTLTGLLLDIGLDPTTYVGAGLVGRAVRAVPGGAKVLEAVSKGGKLAAARVGLAFTPTQEAVLKIVDEALLREGRGAEETGKLVRLIQDTAKTAAHGDPVRSRLYDKALGGYFDVGADELVGYGRRAAEFPALRADTQAMRQTAEAAQRNYLQTLPSDARAFVGRLAPVVRETEDNLLDNLVRVERITPEVAERWRGFHLRPFYTRYADEEKFIEFLTKNDPARAVELLSQIEHGPRVRVSGRGIPSEVGKARELLSTERATLGEVPEASVRIAASHPVYQRAIARGEMFQAIARDYARPELEQLVTLPGADRLYRRMPATEKWGALAEKVVPKEIHDLLVLQFDNPGRWERAIGWWKGLKTVDNPATHGRNIRSMLTQQVPAAIGLRAFDPRVWIRAIREMVEEGPLWREAKEVAPWAYDLFTSRERLRVAQRLTEAKNLTDYFAAPFRAYHTFMARAYNFEDLVGRMAIFTTLRGRGVEARAAALAADRAMINYRRVPPLLDAARRKGVYPFVAFPYGVVTQVLPQALQRPGQAFAGVKATRAFTEPLTPEEERILPRYMRSGGFVKVGKHILALLPWLRDPHGRPQAYDLTYELMFGDVAEQGTPLNSVIAVLTGQANPKTLANLLTPLGQLVGELSWNYSSFTGQEIQRSGEPLAKRVVYGTRALMPGTVFDVAEAAAAKTGLLERAGLSPISALAQSVTGTPTSLGKKPAGIGPALTRTLVGAKTVPIDVPAERVARRVELGGEIAEIDRQMRSVMRSRSLSEPLRRRRLLELRHQRQVILDTYRREGTVPGR